MRERRYSPSLGLLGGARFSTSTHEDIGASGTDTTIGLIATKEIDRFEFAFNAIYTTSGDAGQQDILELPFAIEYSLNHSFSMARPSRPAD